MVKAGSLLFALCISLLIVLSSGSIILLWYNSQMLFNNLLVEEKLIQNISSGMNYYLANSTDWKNNSTRSVDLFDQGNDWVDIEKRSWGVYHIVSCQARQANHRYQNIYLTGDKVPKKPVALYVADINNPISVCGRTTIKGKTILPAQGIKRAYIEGQNFIGSLAPESSTSTSTIPSLSTDIPFTISYLKEINNKDSIIQITLLEEQKTIHNSYYLPTLIIYSAGNIELDNYTLTGNIIVRTPAIVHIRSRSVLSGIIIQSGSTIIDPNFSGDLQIFATDSITVKDNVHLNYPSALCILERKDEKQVSKIELQRNIVIKGMVANFNSPATISKKNNILLDETSQITGLLYSNGYIGMKGNVNGSVYCRGFILKTTSATYDNHLLNVEINSTDLPRYFAGNFPANEVKMEGIIKRLE